MEGLDKLFVVDSAACHGADGCPAHPTVRSTIEELYGEDLLAGHVSKTLSTELTAMAHAVVVMDRAMLSRVGGSRLAINLDIPDPYNQGGEVYRLCAVEISRRLDEIWSQLIRQ